MSTFLSGTLLKVNTVCSPIFKYIELKCIKHYKSINNLWRDSDHYDLKWLNSAKFQMNESVL